MASVGASTRVWARHDPTEQVRTCRLCGREKPIQHFERTSPYKGRVYRRRLCKECRRPSVKVLQQRWNETHRERRLQIWRDSNMRRFLKNRGIPERRFHEAIEMEFERACPLHKLHPDYYHSGRFIEVKRASTKKQYLWSGTSAHFPNLFFRKGRKSLDEQVATYPKPLLVIVFDKDTGNELCRREFG